MTSQSSFDKPPVSPLAWGVAALAGVIAPVAALVLLANGSGPAPLLMVSAPILAVGLMGAGMICAAADGRLWVGIALAASTGLGLVLLALFLGLPALSHPLSMLLVFAIASLSFAARGALFARSALDKGWWIAVFVVAGEAAIVLTAIARPGALPDWLLVLLPAQWATMAIQTALTGPGALAAASALIALGGTAAVTLLVAHLWPRRWPYIVMFTTWLSLSALVWHYPSPPPPTLESVADGDSLPSGRS
ncbi:MAG: hypothetical protein HRT64_11730 [Erythrobacter sp.]|nr:hypothetical protein [Erythrobacter sp.]